MARTRTRTFRVVPEDTRTWDLFLKDFLGGLEDVQIDEMADLAGLSVMGRASGTAGPPAAITATVDGHVLRLSGGALGFGTITTASLSDFTESAQDAIGTALANSATVTLTYNDATPSFTAALVADSVSNSFLADMGQATVKGRAFGSGTGDPVDLTVAQVSAIVDHDQTTNFAANEHIDHTAVTITAGTGLTGGGDISASRTLDVGAGTGITVNANDVAVNVGSAFSWTGIHSFAGGVVGSIISPAQITANQNDYTPTGLLGAFIVRLSSDASRNITGMGRDGNAYIKIVANIGAQNIVFTNEDAASTANQRFALKGAVSYTLLPGAAVVVFYDGTSDRWRIVLV